VYIVQHVKRKLKRKKKCKKYWLKAHTHNQLAIASYNIIVKMVSLIVYKTTQQ